MRRRRKGRRKGRRRGRRRRSRGLVEAVTVCSGARRVDTLVSHQQPLLVV